jgi:hypothetical protein
MKWQAYIAEEDFPSHISSLHSYDSRNNNDVLVEIYHLSEESFRNAIPHE